LYPVAGAGIGRRTDARQPAEIPPLEVAEAPGITAQIAEALETAHEKGVMHRDLKPGTSRLHMLSLRPVRHRCILDIAQSGDCGLTVA
jgi:serine/threonine protein kinase